MKIKKTSHEIKDKILDELKNGPKSVAEIGENINSNWLTVEKFLNELKDDGLVIEVISSPKMKVYRRVDDLAFYGLPFSQDIRDKTFSLLCTIAKKWKEKNQEGPIPSKTILQKIAVEFIESSQRIEVPILRFHYGKTTALRYDEEFEMECKPFNLNSEQNTLLLNLIDKYKKMSARKAEQEQYKKEDMIFYRVKEKGIIQNLLIKDSKTLELGLLKLSALYPLELVDIFPIFDNFIYCSINALNLSSKEDKTGYLQKIKELFSLVWDMVTTAYFFSDAEKYITQDKKELFFEIKKNILNSKILNLSPILEDFKSEVESINTENIPINITERAKEAIHSILED
ncbi:hypothetical protein FJZ19_04995 [Candidatus Pacearchaeota archaeon]|nr:hypothetical protein [Candidatus Pacearchaeota archaeon]